MLLRRAAGIEFETPQEQEHFVKMSLQTGTVAAEWNFGLWVLVWRSKIVRVGASGPHNAFGACSAI